jgi:hypothetical protein
MFPEIGQTVIYQLPHNIGEVTGEVIELGARGALVQWEGGVWADWTPVKKLRQKE